MCSVVSNSLRPWRLSWSSVHGISQTRVLEWEPFPSPGDLPNPGMEPVSPESLSHCRWILYHWATKEPSGWVRVQKKITNIVVDILWQCMAVVMRIKGWNHIYEKFMIRTDYTWRGNGHFVSRIYLEDFNGWAWSPSMGHSICLHKRPCSYRVYHNLINFRLIELQITLFRKNKDMQLHRNMKQVNICQLISEIISEEIRP